MREFSPVPDLIARKPFYLDVAMRIASEMSRMTAGEIASAFGCSDAIGELNRRRFNVFGTDEAEVMPAIMAYYGQAYKHLRADTLSMDELEWADGHLWISSCLYGLLRPFDGISQYRMESNLKLKSTEGKRITDFWRPMLTEMLIDSVNADDGVLVYLDTEEFRSLFDWKRVVSEIRVIEPGFHVMKNGRLVTPSVWAKTCRGAMARFLIQENAAGGVHGNAGVSDVVRKNASNGNCNVAEALELVSRFSYEGFGFSQDASGDELFPQFV
ncbi:MAG: YaaA family protein, partial [Candidatus Cryptobacteroides sp.]